MEIPDRKGRLLNSQSDSVASYAALPSTHNKTRNRGFILRKFLYSLVVLALVSTLAGCGGSSSGSTQQSAPGTSSVAFGIPLHQPGSQLTGGPAASSGGAQAFGAHPEFVDQYSNGKILGYLDGATNQTPVMTVNLAGITWSSSGVPTINIPGDFTGSGTTADGGTISWTSTLSSVSTGYTLNVTANLSTLVNGASHTFGVVETNGQCTVDQYNDPLLCISGNDGYVLAEGQTTFTPTAGPTDLITLTLGGVLQAGFICNTNDPSCSNFGPNGQLGSDGLYHFAAFPEDENGMPVIGYAMPSGGWITTGSWNTPYDNGGWGIVVISGADVVNVTPENMTGTDPFGSNPSGTLGPFTTPNPHKVRSTSVNWYDGEGFKVQCLKAGTAFIGMQMVPSPGSWSAGKVNGFNYNSGTSGNYTAAGAFLGLTGADAYFGNGEGMEVTCSMGSTSIIIN